ncbi:MAG: gamma-glutamylcyclotransferase [Candidatus Sumerlaeia bacterium]|nr:gamma-glutamylcyclotransferase [Candidatus Sumerlaeia bacterium]
MSYVWYFAYGSNLVRDRMGRRTGNILEAKRARLEGYRITFNKRGNDGTGKANIAPNPGDTVWGVVYRCPPGALDILDGYEGVAGGHYARQKVRLRLDGGDELDAVTYVAGNAFIANSLIPSPKYLQTILRGAREYDLPEDYIRRVEALGTQRSTGDQDRPV